MVTTGTHSQKSVPCYIYYRKSLYADFWECVTTEPLAWIVASFLVRTTLWKMSRIWLHRNTTAYQHDASRLTCDVHTFYPLRACALDQPRSASGAWAGSGVSPAAGGEKFWAFFYARTSSNLYIYILYSNTHSLSLSLSKPSMGTSHPCYIYPI